MTQPPATSKTSGTQKVRMSITPDDRDTADRWFLGRGMPAVLTSRHGHRHLLPRSAQALAAYATVVTALLAVYFFLGTSEIYIDGAPTPAERIVLAVIALAVPLAALIGWGVSRLRSPRAQFVVAIAAVAVAAVAGVIQGGQSHLLGSHRRAGRPGADRNGRRCSARLGDRLTMTQVAAMGVMFVRPCRWCC